MLDIKEFISIDILLQVYLILMVADFITGFLKAWKSEGFKSRKIRDGVIRVLGELIGIIVCSVLDVMLSSTIPMLPPGTLIIAVKVLFIFKEFISISENLGAIGVELPKFIAEHLEELKDKTTNPDNTTDIKDYIDKNTK